MVDVIEGSRKVEQCQCCDLPSSIDDRILLWILSRAVSVE